MQRATQFVDEIRSSLEFYTAQTQGARIERVLISGGGSKLAGFIDIVRQRIPWRWNRAGSSARWVRSSRCPRTRRRRRSPCSPPPSASPSPGAARESGQPPPAGHPRRPATAPHGGVVALAGAGVIGLIFVFYVLQLGSWAALKRTSRGPNRTTPDCSETSRRSSRSRRSAARRRRSRTSWIRSTRTRSPSPAS